MRIGLLYFGNDTDDIWGSAISTFYLAEAFRAAGHDVWRKSVNSKQGWLPVVSRKTDLLISEGVPRHRVPRVVWWQSRIKCFWWLSNLYYDLETVQTAGFNAVATNSTEMAKALAETKIASAFIELAVDPGFSASKPNPAYESPVVYLGTYPHKAPKQMDMMFGAAEPFGLALWGCGWENSPYTRFHKGVLPLGDIGALYASCRAVLAMTEEKQRVQGMVNNRVFEALAVGKPLISYRHSYLEQHYLGRYIDFVETEQETRQAIERAIADESRSELALEGQRMVIERETYAARVAEFLSLYENARR